MLSVTSHILTPFPGQAGANQLDCLVFDKATFKITDKLVSLQYPFFVVAVLKRLIAASLMMQVISSRVDMEYITKALKLHSFHIKK